MIDVLVIIHGRRHLSCSGLLGRAQGDLIRHWNINFCIRSGNLILNRLDFLSVVKDSDDYALLKLVNLVFDTFEGRHIELAPEPSQVIQAVHVRVTVLIVR